MPRVCRCADTAARMPCVPAPVQPGLWFLERGAGRGEQVPRNNVWHAARGLLRFRIGENVLGCGPVGASCVLNEFHLPESLGCVVHMWLVCILATDGYRLATLTFNSRLHALQKCQPGRQDHRSDRQRCPCRSSSN